MSDIKLTVQGIEPAQSLDLIQDIQINPGAIVSKTLRKSAALNLTLFAFDKGQALSGHSSPMDAYVQVLSGKMDITIGKNTSTLSSNQIILMPAGINHALDAVEASRMLLTMVSI